MNRVWCYFYAQVSGILWFDNLSIVHRQFPYLQIDKDVIINHVGSGINHWLNFTVLTAIFIRSKAEIIQKPIDKKKKKENWLKKILFVGPYKFQVCRSLLK